MKVGDLVKVKYPIHEVHQHRHPKAPHIGVIIEFVQWGVKSKFARVCLMNGHRATYRLDNLEVL